MGRNAGERQVGAGWADSGAASVTGHLSDAGVRSGASSAHGAPSAANAYRVGPVRPRASRNGAMVFSVVTFAVAFAVALAVAYVLMERMSLAGVAIALVVAALAACSVHVTMDWEKAVVMRFGKFNRVAGPGLVFTIPIVEFYSLRVDQRVTPTFFGAEETLTSDLVPVNVDAVLFWIVFDARKACTEVDDYAQAVAWIAQTSLRKAIGRATVAEVATRRDQLDAELKSIVEEMLNPWGISVIDVEIRDIVVPKELQEAMSAEAVAERAKEARMVLAEAEKDISEMLMEASAIYGEDENAMRLRTMHLAYESVKASGGTLVLPSSFAEGFTEKPSSEK